MVTDFLTCLESYMPRINNSLAVDSGFCVLEHSFSAQAIYSYAITFTSCLHRATGQRWGPEPSQLFPGMYKALCVSVTFYISQNMSELFRVLYVHQISKLFLLRFLSFCLFQLLLPPQTAAILSNFCWMFW